MNIAFVITNLDTGGAEKMLYKLLKHLDRKQFNPIVISLMGLGDIGQQIQNLDIPVHTLNIRRGSIPKFGAIFKLISIFQASKIEMVHTWMYHADFLGGVAAKFAGVKTVIWGIRHSNLSSKLNKPSTLFVVRICALISKWIPDGILSCSNRALSVHANVGYDKEKMMVIPNGFDLGSFFPDPLAKKSVCAEIGVKPNVKFVGLIGRYDPQKNHLGFIRAAEIVKKLMPNVHFIMAGSGVSEENKVLMSAIDKSGLGSCFHLLGYRNDVRRLMCSFDVLASSSDGEAFPNILGEAMACGVPCVVTDVGDSGEIVGSIGNVVPPGDMELFAEKIVHMLTLLPEQVIMLSQSSRKRVAENYEINHVVRRYEKYYNSFRL